MIRQKMVEKRQGESRNEVANWLLVPKVEVNASRREVGRRAKLTEMR